MRFSLRSLFSGIAAAALYCCVLFVVPPEVSSVCMVVMTLLALPIIVGGIVYSCGTWRAFWIGCAVGYGPISVYSVPTMLWSFMPIVSGEEGSEYVLSYALAAFHCFIVFNGGIVVLVRWTCKRRGADANVAIRQEEDGLPHDPEANHMSTAASRLSM